LFSIVSSLSLVFRTVSSKAAARPPAFSLDKISLSARALASFTSFERSAFLVSNSSRSFLKRSTESVVVASSSSSLAMIDSSTPLRVPVEA